MSPASYLTAPPRVALVIIPPLASPSVALFWLSLAVAVVFPAIGIVLVVRRGLALWRDLKRGGKALVEGLDAVGARVERTSTAAEGLASVTARAEPSLARLRVSLAVLAVLRSAVRDVQDAAGRVTAIYPRK
jgi:hypothetical protein